MFNFPTRKSTTVRIVEPALRRNFTDVEIASMARLGEVVHVSSGDTLMTEGTPGSHAFFISTGTAAVSRDNERLAGLSAGDLVGERSLVTGETRNATVTALMPITALRFDSTQFARLRLELDTLKTMSDELVASRG